PAAAPTAARPSARPCAAPAPEREHEKHQRNGKNEKDQKQEEVRADRLEEAAECTRCRARQGLALYQRHDRARARGDAAVEIARLEMRRDDFVDHAARPAIGDSTFELAPNLDPDSAVTLGDDQDHTVIDFRPADLPGL